MNINYGTGKLLGEPAYARILDIVRGLARAGLTRDGQFGAGSGFP